MAERQSTFAWFSEVENIQVAKKPRNKYLYMVHVVIDEGVFMVDSDVGLAEFVTPCPERFFMKKSVAEDVVFNINRWYGQFRIAQTLRFLEHHAVGKLINNDVYLELVRWRSLVTRPEPLKKFR